MPSGIAAFWCGAAVAFVAAVGAGVVYWTNPDFLRPRPAAAVTAPAPAVPAPVRAAPPAASAAIAPASPAPAAAVAALEPPPAPAAVKPAFDVVRVEPSGETVVAGRAAPNAKVKLVDGGRVLAEATADRAGQFVMIPEPLAPGEHELALATGDERSNPAPVTVAPPPPPAPATQTAVAAAPTAAPAPAVAVKSIDTSPGGRFVVHGSASPNATVRLYLSGAYVGDAKTKDDGRWSLTIQRGATPGPYVVRADEIKLADASVVARAEAPFDYPRVLSGQASASPAATAGPADLVVDSVQHVERGVTLWGLSQTFYGNGSRYQLIFAANTAQIRNPNLIYPGQTFVVPKAP